MIGIVVETLDPDRAKRVLLSNAPLVEGAVVESSIGKFLKEVGAAAVAALQMRKVER